MARFEETGNDLRPYWNIVRKGKILTRKAG